ncbi:MAG: peptidoglycan glycosyltransferase [Reichenbachiella sp.]
MNDDRKYIIRAAVLLVGLTFLFKLFSIQVLNDDYKVAAESNIIQKVIEYPYRGLIFDRNDELLVHNEPIYDLMVVPKEVNVQDTLLFCKLFNITKEDFVDKIKSSRRYSSIQPSVFIKQISNESFASIQDLMLEIKGFYPKARTVRGYHHQSLSNVLGYIGEINTRQLRNDTANYYNQGDYIGISGIESSYEQFLRGKRGVHYKMVNARGVEKGDFKDGELDTLSIPGESIKLSIDLGLQQYAEKLMEGKVGSAIAIDPSNGEVLAFVSAPTYDPRLLSGRNFGNNYSQLTKDSLKPLFNRPLMAMYPPGSIFKIVQGLIALEEGVITATEELYCDGTLIGDHAPVGYYDMRKGIMLSSNNYFHRVFRRVIERNTEISKFKEAPIGLTNWKEQVQKFGFGKPLGIDLPNERSGLIPGVEVYNKIYGAGRWKYSNISSMSIGQGELLMNPIQMVNLAVIMANRGYYYRPHIVKSIGNTGYIKPEYQEKIETGISSEHFPPVIQGMQDALSGTAPRAIIRDIEICGKTGTVQNPHGEDHSVFMAFAPKERPKIAISVYVENAGWGGRAAASISSLLIEKYIRGEISRPRLWLEKYVLEGDFADRKTE